MISVDHLSFTYKKNLSPTVKDISFSVEQGQVFGFLGPSGAGKSTTQKVLIKLLHNFEGNVYVLGRALRDWGHEYYEQVGVGFELPNHYPKLSAWENLHFFASFYTVPVLPLMPLLERVGLAGDVHKRVGDFSKGMKMRLNFIRAIMHDPQLIFLDEPTAGLDPGNARLLKDLILELKAAGKTIFLTTHHMHDADELCDQVAFMVEGEIRLIDNPASLKRQHADRNLTIQYKDSELREQHFPLVGLGTNAEFLELIRSHPIESIHSTETSLEQVFLEVTGRSLI